MVGKHNILDKYTLIPLGVVISFLGVLGGGMFWMTTVASNAASAKTGVVEVKTEMKQYMDKLDTQNIEIIQRLSKIEGRLSR